MADREITMPDLGEGLTESDLVAWTVAEGDTVELNQVIAEVETAKALVQLPSPYAGVVARLLVEPGTTVPVGSPIASITVHQEAETGARHPGDGEPDPAGRARDPHGSAERAGAPGGGDGAVRDAPHTSRNAVLVGYGPPVEGGARPHRRARARAWSAAHREPAPATSSPPTGGGSPVAAPHERPRSFPPVRKLAQELGVDLAALTGTGADGLITREDVLHGASPVTSPAATTPPSAPREVRTRITGVRKHTAAAMVASAFTAPHATEFLTVDVTPTMELLASISAERAFAGHRVTILTMVAKAMMIALRRSPALNSHWDEDAGEIVQFGYVNLGIAAATPRGLLVPHIKDAERLDLTALADAITALTTAARAGTTSPADLTGGTLSITNIGVFGIDAGTPILNPGEAAIVAMGAVRRQPWEHHDEIALRSVMTLSLSFDHRLVDGEQASRFLADVGAILAAPGRTVTMV